MKYKIINDLNPKTLILIHSGNSSIEEWNEFIDKEKENYRLILISISGHGDDRENQYTSIEQNAQEICSMVKEKGYYNCFIYGRGLGGQIALSMIENAPELFSKIILESTICEPSSFIRKLFQISAIRSYKPTDKEIEEKGKLSIEKFKYMTKDSTKFSIDSRINGYSGKCLSLYSSFDDKLFKKSSLFLSNYVQNTTIKSYSLPHYFGIYNLNDIILDIDKFLRE